MLGAEQILDRAERVHLTVSRADDRALFDVRADHERGAAVRVDVVGAVLHVVFSDDDQRVGGVTAVRHRFDEAAQREIAIGLLRFRRVDAAQRAAETAHVIVADSDE